MLVVLANLRFGDVAFRVFQLTPQPIGIVTFEYDLIVPGTLPSQL
jgi:hypothetical protein